MTGLAREYGEGLYELARDENLAQLIHEQLMDVRELLRQEPMFVKLLGQKERFECFEDCVKWFHQRYNEELGIVEAFVTSAVALSDNDREALRQRLAQISGKKVHLVCDVDPALIGGVRVEMDGRRYDNTMQDRLGRLKRSLTRGL